MDTKRTLTAGKGDVGSIGGHTEPIEEMLRAAEKVVTDSSLVLSHHIDFTGDDIKILTAHDHGIAAPGVHNMIWEALQAATDVAEKHGLYAYGQDLVADAPSGNLRGKGPGIAEVLIGPNETRKAEAALVIAADKTGPGAFNFPLYQAFGHKPIALAMPKFQQGFTWHIVDMDHASGDRTIVLNSPEDLYLIGFLLKQVNRFAVREIYLRRTGELAVSASVDRLHNIGDQKYVGKDDPVSIVRVQSDFLAPEEVVEPYSAAHLVPGGTRGSKNRPLMPVAINTAVTGADCQPIVTCLAFSVNKDGILSKPSDMFATNAWDLARQKALWAAEYMRGFDPFEPSTAIIKEMEYADWGITQKQLEDRFVVEA